MVDWGRVQDITNRIPFDHRDDRHTHILKLFDTPPIPDSFARLSDLQRDAFVVHLHHQLALTENPLLVSRHLELLHDRSLLESDKATLGLLREQLRGELSWPRSRLSPSSHERPATDIPMLPRETLRRLADVRTVAEATGYAPIDAAVLSTPPVESSLKAFLGAIDRMPADLYDADQARRRFVTFAHLYQSDDHAPAILYFMKAALDPASGSRLFPCLVPAGTGPDVDVLHFAPVPDEALATNFLDYLIKAGFHASPLRPEHCLSPLLVDVQVIRYEPRRGTVAQSGPRGASWASCVFLLEEENVEGPEYVLYSDGQSATLGTEARDTPPLERFTLSRPLAGYSIDHTKVVPYCGPTRIRKGTEYGRKTLLFLSYRPLVPLGPDDETIVRQIAARPDLTGALIPITTMPPAVIELTVRSRTSRGATRGPVAAGSGTAHFRLGLY